MHSWALKHFINLLFFSLRWKVDLIIYQLHFYLVQNEASKFFPQANKQKAKLFYFATRKFDIGEIQGQENLLMFYIISQTFCFSRL